MQGRFRDLVLGMLISILALGPFGAVVQAASVDRSACAEIAEAVCCGSMGHEQATAATDAPGDCCCSPDDAAAPATEDDGAPVSPEDCERCVVFCCLSGCLTVMVVNALAFADAATISGDVWSFQRAMRTTTIAPEPPPPNRVSF